jgi:hypothetical protein
MKKLLLILHSIEKPEIMSETILEIDDETATLPDKIAAAQNELAALVEIGDVNPEKGVIEVLFLRNLLALPKSEAIGSRRLTD